MSRRAQVLLSLVCAGCGILLAQADPPETAQSLLASATNLYNESHYPQAIGQLRQAEALARRENDVATLLDIKQVEGNALRTLGRLDEALRTYQEWFRLNRTLPQPQPEGRATRFLAVLYREIGDVEQAETYARQALKLARAEKNRQLEAGCLLSLGALEKDRGRFREAIPWHQQALALAEDQKLDRLQAEILNSLGNAEDQIGRLEDAEKHFRRAMAIAEATNYLGLEAQVTARTGQLDMQRGRFDDAIELFGRVTQLNHQLGDPLTKVLEVDFRWAQAERAAGHLENALAHYRDAIRDVERLEELTVPDELGRALPVATSREPYEESVDLLVQMNRSAEALELADSGRARSFVDLLNESHIDARSNLTEEQGARERRLKRNVAEHRDQPRELAHALGELEDFYLDLRRSNPAYAELRRPGTTTAEEIQRELTPPDSAFIEYLIGADRSYAWVVTSEGVRQATLPSRGRLERLIQSYRKLVSQPVTELTPRYRARQIREQASQLYRLVVAPIEPFFSGHKRLIVVPDGVLANVPIESLVDSKGRYLLTRYTIVYSQSASASLMLRSLAREMPPPEPRLLSFGDPSYDTPAFAPVPYTREEATAIARLFPPENRELLLGRAASESALKRADLDHFGYLHFAVHGVVDDGNPERSGLALAHEPGSSEDGILRAAEIARLRMNARLVVLSGCRTADGKLLQGEGLLTISRSFYYAGARAVVATLWNVDDISTAELMKSFYSRIRAGLAPEDALRQAKIEMQRGNRTLWKNPWFWSPFIISQ